MEAVVLVITEQVAKVGRVVHVVLQAAGVGALMHTVEQEINRLTMEIMVHQELVAQELVAQEIIVVHRELLALVHQEIIMVNQERLPLVHQELLALAHPLHVKLRARAVVLWTPTRTGACLKDQENGKTFHETLEQTQTSV
jgi:hypothetical protein